MRVFELGAGSLRARVLTLGAALVDLRLDGVGHALTLGSGDLSLYRGKLRHFGAIVGPVANRIAGGAAEIDGKLFTFEQNDGRNTLHSGAAGTHAKVWEVIEARPDLVHLGVDLPDGEGGFPGKRRVEALYAAQAPGALTLRLSARSDAPTLMSLAHHPYWTLDEEATWEKHMLQVDAERYLPADGETLPTGERARVEGTRFDFRTARRPEAPFDNTLCLSDAKRPLTRVARLCGAGGTCLEIATTAPGLHVYDGGGIPAGPAAHDGRIMAPGAAIAIEPQHWPDAPHHRDFPSILLRPGEVWSSETRYDFSA